MDQFCKDCNRPPVKEWKQIVVTVMVVERTYSSCQLCRDDDDDTPNSCEHFKVTSLVIVVIPTNITTINKT